MEQLKVVTVTVELGGGRQLRATRYTEPNTGRDVVTVGREWLADVVGVPTEGRDTLRLPADALPDLLAALQELEGADRE